MPRNRFERNAARCVRLAQGAGDAVLSYGFMKMAEAWRDLDRRRSHSPTRHRTRRPSSTHRHIRRRVPNSPHPRMGHKKRRARWSACARC